MTLALLGGSFLAPPAQSVQVIVSWQGVGASLTTHEGLTPSYVHHSLSLSFCLARTLSSPVHLYGPRCETGRFFWGGMGPGEVLSPRPSLWLTMDTQSKPLWGSFPQLSACETGLVDCVIGPARRPFQAFVCSEVLCFQVLVLPLKGVTM